MSILLLAARRSVVPPIRIFYDALVYHEVRLNKEDFQEYYNQCATSDCYPTIVEDYALAVLNGGIRYEHRSDTGGGEDNPERGVPPPDGKDS